MSADTVPTRRGPAGWLLDPLVDLLFLRAEVTSTEQITPRTRAIRLAGPGVADLVWRPGQQIRIQAKDPQGQGRDGMLGGALRTYSIWSYDGRELELRVLDHGDGPGARWSRGLRLGDEVVFRKPEGKFVGVDSAPYHLFVGEETAAVAFGAIVRGLPSEAKIFGVIEVDGPQDQFALPRVGSGPGSDSGDLAWRFRDGASAADSATLVAAIRELSLPAEPGVAYVAGEARTCQAVRAHLVRERGWPRRSVLVKPFWAPGKRGME